MKLFFIFSLIHLIIDTSLLLKFLSTRETMSFIPNPQPLHMIGDVRESLPLAVMVPRLGIRQHKIIMIFMTLGLYLAR